MSMSIFNLFIKSTPPKQPTTPIIKPTPQITQPLEIPLITKPTKSPQTINVVCILCNENVNTQNYKHYCQFRQR